MVFIMIYLSLGAQIWHMFTVLPATHTFIHKWNEPYLHLTPAADYHCTLAGTHFPSC